MIRIFFYGKENNEAQSVSSQNLDTAIFLVNALRNDGWKAFAVYCFIDKLPQPLPNSEKAYQQYLNDIK